jgi:23S rRNA (adenine2503-C2)-methyltransferase
LKRRDGGGSTSPKPDLFALTPHALVEGLRGPGRARAVYRLLREGDDPFAALPEKAIARLSAIAEPSVVRVERIHRSRDGTMKLLVALFDGSRIESVLIADARRMTLCVSSQVGCARGCTFCQTASMKLARNLSAAEIVAQVVIALRLVKAHGLPVLRNVVFMGMGEPLDNLDAVRDALAIICSSGLGLGFGPGHVTVSTVGPSAAAIRRAADLPGRLAWSLHAADDRLRRTLVPTQRGSVRDLLGAFQSVVAERREPLFVEVTLIDGVNDAPSAADAIVDLFADFGNEVRFNLLPMNPILASDLRPSRVVDAFAARLKAAGYWAMVRKARGDDARAACGQLAVLEPS